LGFSQSLREENWALWNRILDHPFIVELSSGTLPLGNFIYYIQQDYLYLIDFARCVGLAAVKSETLDEMRVWVDMMKGCLRYEVEMLEELCKTLKIPRDRIMKAEKAPTNTAYGNYLLRVAYTGRLGEIITSLLPCMWTYMDIGDKLAANKGREWHSAYEAWLRGYTSPAYRGLVATYIKAVDESAKYAGSRQREKMRDLFTQSLRYEYLFWDMAYSMEKWDTVEAS